MNIAIVHRAAAKALLLKKRLRHENIQCDLIEITPQLLNKFKDKLYAALYSKVMKSCAVFFYLDEADEMLQTAAKNLSSHIAGTKVVISDGDSTPLKGLARSLGLHFIAISNLSTRHLALNFKMIVFKSEPARATAHLLESGEFKLDYQHYCLRRNGAAVALRNKEFALLEFFMLNRGKVVTRTMILEAVWDRNAMMTSNTVDVHIARLRKKLRGRNGKSLIRTVHCIGYKFDDATMKV